MGVVHSAMHKFGRPAAFTLIELLVVISIIALLLSVIMPALQKAKTQARLVIDLSNLHQSGVAVLSYETANGRLPQHYTENPDGTTKSAWQEQLASNRDSTDVRPLWEPYVGTLNFFNCPLIKHLDITLQTIPAEASRVYCSYSILGGFYCDRSQDRSQGVSGWLKDNRWTKINQTWKYDGRKVEVLMGDRLYRAFSIMQYRINHGQRIDGLSQNYHPYDERNGDASQFAHSVFGGPILDMTVDLRKKATACYVFKDGSAAKYAGDDSAMITLYDPPIFGNNSAASSRTGEQLIPVR